MTEFNIDTCEGEMLLFIGLFVCLLSMMWLIDAATDDNVWPGVEIDGGKVG